MFGMNELDSVVSVESSCNGGALFGSCLSERNYDTGVLSINDG